MTRKNRHGLALLLTLAVPLLLGLGCAEFGDPDWSAVRAGRIEGRVTTGELPVEATIEVDRVNDGSQEHFYLSLEVDDDGSYGADVPAGDYVVYLRPDRTNRMISFAQPEPVYDDAPPDTLPVDAANSPVRVDFTLGRLDLDLSFPASMEGYMAYVEICRPVTDGSGDSPTRIARQHDIIENGRISSQTLCLLPGDYTIAFVAEDLQAEYEAFACEEVWVPGTRDPLVATKFAVHADSLSRIDCPFAIEPLRIEGRVAGSWLDFGISDRPLLSVVDLDSLLLIDQLWLDADGGFCIDLFLPAEFKLLVEQGNGMGQWFGGPGYADADIFTLGPGGAMTGLELEQSGLRLVVDNPLPGSGSAWCRLYDPGSLDLLNFYRVYFSSSLQAGIPNLCPGEYLLRIEHDDYDNGIAAWLPQWFDRAETAGGARPILITEPGEIVTLDLDFDEGGVIAGRLELTTPSTEYYYVLVYPEDLSGEWARRSLGALDRTFTFVGVPDGRYKVGALTAALYRDATSQPPPGTVWYPSTPDWNAAGVIEIIDASTVSSVDIVIPGA